MEPDPREAKLPRWARFELERLRANLTAAQATTEALIGGDNPHSNVHVEAHWAPSGTISTPYRVARFYVGPTESDWIEVRNSAELGLYVFGSDEIMFSPSSANTGHLQLKSAFLQNPPLHLKGFKCGG